MSEEAKSGLKSYQWIFRRGQDYVEIALEGRNLSWVGPFPNKGAATAWIDEQRRRASTQRGDKQET